MSNLVGRVTYKEEDTNPTDTLLVSTSGSIVFRLKNNNGYGFNAEGIFNKSYCWSFRAKPKDWRLATEEEKESFNERIKDHDINM